MDLVKKMAIILTFFLDNIGQENVFYDILEGKNDFLDYQKKDVQKNEKIDFIQRGYPTVLLKKWQFFQLLLFI